MIGDDKIGRSGRIDFPREKLKHLAGQLLLKLAEEGPRWQWLSLVTDRWDLLR